MQSLALLGGFGASDPRVGPAKADQSALPLGMIWAKSTHGGPSNGAASTRPAAVAAPTRPPLPTPGGCPPQLPPPPAGPPVLVLFPATLHLAVFFSPPPLGTLAAVVLALMGLFGSWAWGWGLVSTAGIFSGLVAGFVVGLGVRARPVEGWGCISLSILGIALLGGGFASLALGTTLALSTLWRHGWWLYLQPECAPVVFFFSGTTADVALGFLLASLVQVHRTKKSPQDPASQQGAAQPSSAQPETPAMVQHSAPGGEQTWDAVTPPGLFRAARR